MKSLRLASLVVLMAFLAAGVVRAQDTDQDKKEKESLRERILKKVDERLKRETERIKKEIEQILAEELGAAKRAEKSPEKKPDQKPEKKPQKKSEKASLEISADEPGWLGLWMESLSDELAEDLGVKRDDGAVIADVVAGGPAEKSGLKKNDLVLSFGGEQIGTPEEMLAKVNTTKAGETVKVVVQRADGKKTLTVELGNRPSNAAVAKTPRTEKKVTAKKETAAKPERRDGGTQGQLRDRIKGFLDKMMTEDKHEDEGKDEAESKVERPARKEDRTERPATNRLQDRIKDFMDRMAGGGKGEEEGEDAGEDEDDENGESEDSMRDEGKGGNGIEQLGEIAKRFFDEILNDRRGGKDEGEEGLEGEEGDEEGEEGGQGPGFERLLEGARSWMEKNAPDLRDQFEKLQEGIGKGKDGMGKGAQGLREQVQRLLEGLQGENGEELQDMLKGMDFDQLRDRFRDMFQGGDFEKMLGDDDEGGDLEGEDEGMEEAEEAPARKNVPAEREAVAPQGGAFLGVNLDEVTEELRAHHELGERGVMVTAVVEGSPAGKAGLKQWDILLSCNGKDVNSVEDVIALMQKGKPGQKVKIDLLRRGKDKTVEVELGARNSAPSPKLLRPFHFVSLDLPQGVLFAPGGDPKQDEAKKNEAKKRAPARRQGADQMRDQLRQGLSVFRSFMKDQELYWQVATKDGQVFYKRKIDPQELMGMAQDGGGDFLRNLFSGRRDQRSGDSSGRHESGPVTELESSRKGGVRVYEAPGIRIEIRDDAASQGGSRRQAVEQVIRDLPGRAGKALEAARIHIDDLGDEIKEFNLPIGPGGRPGRILIEKMTGEDDGDLREKLSELHGELKSLRGPIGIRKHLPQVEGEDNVIFFANPNEHRTFDIEIEECPGSVKVIRKQTGSGEQCCEQESAARKAGKHVEEKKIEKKKTKKSRKPSKNDAI